MDEKQRKHAISAKIAKLIREGKTPAQAAGQAYGMEREGTLGTEGGYHPKKKG